jgi:hypothetical protein
VVHGHGFKRILERGATGAAHTVSPAVDGKNPAQFAMMTAEHKVKCSQHGSLVLTFSQLTTASCPKRLLPLARCLLQVGQSDYKLAGWFQTAQTALTTDLTPQSGGKHLSR